MSEPPDYARLAAALLVRYGGDPRLAPPPDRDHGISTVAQAIAERERLRRVRRALGVGAGLAAALALLLAASVGNQRFKGNRAPSASAPTFAKPSDVLVGHAASRSYLPGSRISASSSPLSVHFGPITRLYLEEETDVVYESGGVTRRFRLLRGSVHLRVAKLSKNERFIVETPDAEVEVRGTEFEVSLAPEWERCSSRTRVSVIEGTVELRVGGKSQNLPAGQSVDTCVPTVLSPAATASSWVLDRLKPRAALPGERHAAARASAVTQSSNLAPVTTGTGPEAMSVLSAQNELYARALGARRAGNSSEALRLYEELITRFSGGPLEESAVAGRMRILAVFDEARARTEAHRYLSRYPQGFAAKEARRLLARPQP